MTASNSVGRVMLLSASADHLAQFVLLGEFTAERPEILDQLVAGSENGVFGGDLAISLDAEEHLVHKWMRDLSE